MSSGDAAGTGITGTVGAGVGIGGGGVSEASPDVDADTFDWEWHGEEEPEPLGFAQVSFVILPPSSHFLPCSSSIHRMT